MRSSHINHNATTMSRDGHRLHHCYGQPHRVQGVLERVIAAVDPDTVIHNASLIDLRPVPGPLLEAVNVKATQFILELCRRRAAESGRLTRVRRNRALSVCVCVCVCV